MKKHLIVLSLVIYVIISCFLLNNLNKTTPVSSSSSLFGRVVTNNAMLLKTPTKVEDSLNCYFLLEETYFVIVLNEENNDFYYVSYQDVKGYVKKNDIQLVNEQISFPYLTNITFDIIKPCFLSNTPKNNTSSQIISLTPQTNIVFYGKIYGDEIYKNSGNLWYYSKIQNGENFITGYIHSSYTNNLSPITQNTIVTTKFISSGQTTNLLNLNLTSQTTLIIVVSLPILFILFLLLKGFKKI